MLRNVLFALMLIPVLAHGQVLPDPIQKVELIELTTMKAERDAVIKHPIDWSKAIPMLEKQWKRLTEIVAVDMLKTGGDFYIASLLADDPMGFFEHRQRQHELALTALLLDEPNAPVLVARTWDMLHMGMARPQRIGTLQEFDHEKNAPAPAKLDPTSVPTVRDILLKPEDARRRAQDTKDNQELQDIRAADQKARESFSLNTSQADMLKMMASDKARRARVIEILLAGQAKTSKDFEAAALVFQHSNELSGFQLAHELAITSVVLGGKDAAWLISRSYDRMLLRAGYRQRYATNYNSLGLQPYSEGVNDRMRQLAKTESLEKAKKRGENMKGQTMGGG